MNSTGPATPPAAASLLSFTGPVSSCLPGPGRSLPQVLRFTDPTRIFNPHAACASHWPRTATPDHDASMNRNAAIKSDSAQHWIVSSRGTTANFYAAGRVGAAVARHYGCIPRVNFPNCYGQTADTVNDPALEIEYAPKNVASGLCLGVASTAVQGEVVTLQPLWRNRPGRYGSQVLSAPRQRCPTGTSR